MKKQSQVVPLRKTEIIANEAADWLAKLDGGNLSTEDRHALKTWLSRDPEHGHVLKNLASIWSDENTEWQVRELLTALDASQMPVIITQPNADTGGRLVAYPGRRD